MSLYFAIIRFNFLRFLAYPLEMLAAFLKWGCEIGFIVLFWVVVGESSGGIFEIRQLIAYFLIASAIDVFISAARLTFGKVINDLIKKGELSSHLIRPIPTVGYIYANYVGRYGMNFVIGGLALIAGLFAASPSSLEQIVLFIVFLTLAICISFSLNLITGIFAFYTTEALGLRLTIGHIVRVFSGILIPISLFPEHVQSILSLTFLPSLVYVPTSILTQLPDPSAITQMLGTGIFWSVALYLIATQLWKQALRSYDAIGI